MDRVPGYEPGGRGFNSCRARQYSTTYEPQTRPILVLPDLCRTFYPQLASVRIRNAQGGARLLAIQHEVCLLEQAANVGARVMPRHRMIGVAEQHLSILDGYTCSAQAAREGMSKESV